MTEFVLGSYRLEVDVEATRAWYGRYGNATGGCGCAYCRNYAAAVGVLPPEAAAFLEPLGLNLRRPGDIGEYGPRQGGRRAARCPRRHRRVRHRYGTVPPELPGALLPVLAFHDPALGAGGTGR